jgi:hypothetical protein
MRSKGTQEWKELRDAIRGLERVTTTSLSALETYSFIIQFDINDDLATIYHILSKMEVDCGLPDESKGFRPIDLRSFGRRSPAELVDMKWARIAEWESSRLATARDFDEAPLRELKLRRYQEKPSERRAREAAEAVRRARKLERKRLERAGF